MTTTKQAHTPTPWTVTHQLDGRVDIIADGNQVAVLGSCLSKTDNPLLDDAAFIVRAVNSFDDLLEACRCARTMGTLAERCTRENLIKMLDEAIAKAEQRRTP